MNVTIMAFVIKHTKVGEYALFLTFRRCKLKQ